VRGRRRLRVSSSCADEIPASRSDSSGYVKESLVLVGPFGYGLCTSGECLEFREWRMAPIGGSQDNGNYAGFLGFV